MHNNVFRSLGLSNDVSALVARKGYRKPTPVQQKAIPLILRGDNLLVIASTGTGKTEAFILPVISKLPTVRLSRCRRPVRVLVLVPTRELVLQLNAVIQGYKEKLGFSSFAVFGGVSINRQMMELRAGTDLLVATPGRLLDLIDKNAINLSKLETLIIDEADLMLGMGFSKDLYSIVDKLPNSHQTLLFSATWLTPMETLSKRILDDFKEVRVEDRTSKTMISQKVHLIESKDKYYFLLKIIRSKSRKQVLVFVNTKHSARMIAKKLKRDDVTADDIHSDKVQSVRNRAIRLFKGNEIKVLVATDVISRGLDVELLPCIINYDLPAEPETYIHRIGRTGRMYSVGEAISLVSPEEKENLSSIESLLGYKIKHLNLYL